MAAALLGALLLGASPAARGGVAEDLPAARELHRQGDFQGARAALVRIIHEHGDENAAAEAYYHLALLSRDGPDYLRYLDLYLDHGGRRGRLGPEVQLRAGRYYYALGDYRNALTRFEAARELRGDATRREARYWIGLSLAALAEREDAARSLEEVASDAGAGPIREPALFALGEVRRAAGDYAAAAGAFRTCLEAFPRGDYAPAALLGEASAGELLGNREAAKSLYARIVAAFPGSAEAADARQRLRGMRAPVPRPVPAPVGAPGSAAVEAPAAPTVEPGGFSVQVGAFASEANALKLADDLTGRGYPGVRVERGTGEDRLLHVRFGDYPDHAAAVKAGEEVSATLGLRYQIVPPAAPGKP